MRILLLHLEVTSWFCWLLLSLAASSGAGSHSDACWRTLCVFLQAVACWPEHCLARLINVLQLLATGLASHGIFCVE